MDFSGGRGDFERERRPDVRFGIVTVGADGCLLRWDGESGCF